MPTDNKLGDYIGTLISEMAQARMQVDMEAARIAAIYKEDPLLKHFPIPRFRLPEVEIETSVVVSSVETADEEISPRGGNVNPRKIKGELLKSKPVFLRIMKLHNVDIADSKLDKIITNYTGILEKDNSSRLGVGHTIRGLNTEIMKSISGSMVIKDKKKFEIEIAGALAVAVFSATKKPPRMHVQAKSSVVREMVRGNNGTDSLVKIKMKITEESYQWLTSEDGDVLVDE